MLERVPDDFHVLCISYPTHKEQTYAELATHVLQKLGDIRGNYILLGESFSGPVALLVNEQKPSGLLGIILAATFISAPNLRMGRFLPWALGFRLARPLFAARIALSRASTRPLLKAALRELEKVSPRVMAFRVAEIFSVDVEEQLKECAIPLAYFRGKYDYVVPSRNLRKIQVLKPNIKVVEFNTQHFLLQSAPEEAWVAISEFVKNIQEGRQEN